MLACSLFLTAYRQEPDIDTIIETINDNVYGGLLKITIPQTDGSVSKHSQTFFSYKQAIFVEHWALKLCSSWEREISFLSISNLNFICLWKYSDNFLLAHVDSLSCNTSNSQINNFILVLFLVLIWLQYATIT